MSTIIFSRDARQDLVDIKAHLSPRSADITQYVLDCVLREIEKLAIKPRMGHRRRDVADQGILFLTVFRYQVAYVVDDDSVSVLRVIHTARDYRKIKWT